MKKFSVCSGVHERSIYRGLKKVPVFKKNEPLLYYVGHHNLLFGHKIITPLLYLLFSMKFALTILSFVDFIINRQLQVFLKKYSLSLCMSFVAIIWIGVEKLLIGGPKSDRFEKIKCFWYLETATSTTQRKIDKRLRFASSKYKIVMIWSSTLATFSVLAVFFNHSSIYPEKMYVQKIFAFSPMIAFLLECFVIISHALWITLCPTMLLFTKYGALTINIQLNLLSDFLKQIEIYEFSDDTNIGKHLKICCTQHIMICSFRQKIQRMATIPILLFVLAGILYFLGCLVFIYYSDNFLDVLQVLGILATATFVMLDICNDGQNIQDEFELFANNLVNTKWYEWNEVNKKILLLMIVQSQKSAAIEALKVPVDRTLIIKILKTVYQIFLMIQSTM